MKAEKEAYRQTGTRQHHRTIVVCKEATLVIRLGDEVRRTNDLASFAEPRQEVRVGGLVT